MTLDQQQQQQLEDDVDTAQKLTEELRQLQQWKRTMSIEEEIDFDMDLHYMNHSVRQFACEPSPVKGDPQYIDKCLYCCFENQGQNAINIKNLFQRWKKQDLNSRHIQSPCSTLCQLVCSDCDVHEAFVACGIIPMLVALLGSKIEFVQFYSARMLSALASNYAPLMLDAVQPLVKLAQNGVAMERKEAACCLGKIAFREKNRVQDLLRGGVLEAILSVMKITNENFVNEIQKQQQQQQQRQKQSNKNSSSSNNNNNNSNNVRDGWYQVDIIGRGNWDAAQILNRADDICKIIRRDAAEAMAKFMSRHSSDAVEFLLGEKQHLFREIIKTATMQLSESAEEDFATGHHCACIIGFMVAPCEVHHPGETFDAIMRDDRVAATLLRVLVRMSATALKTPMNDEIMANLLECFELLMNNEEFETEISKAQYRPVFEQLANLVELRNKNSKSQSQSQSASSSPSSSSSSARERANENNQRSSSSASSDSGNNSNKKRPTEGWSKQVPYFPDEWDNDLRPWLSVGTLPQPIYPSLTELLHEGNTTLEQDIQDLAWSILENLTKGPQLPPHLKAYYEKHRKENGDAGVVDSTTTTTTKAAANPNTRRRRANRNNNNNNNNNSMDDSDEEEADDVDSTTTATKAAEKGRPFLPRKANRLQVIVLLVLVMMYMIYHFVFEDASHQESRKWFISIPSFGSSAGSCSSSSEE